MVVGPFFVSPPSKQSSFSPVFIFSILSSLSLPPSPFCLCFIFLKPKPHLPGSSTLTFLFGASPEGELSLLLFLSYFPKTLASLCVSFLFFSFENSFLFFSFENQKLFLVKLPSLSLFLLKFDFFLLNSPKGVPWSSSPSVLS